MGTINNPIINKFLQSLRAVAIKFGKAPNKISKTEYTHLCQQYGIEGLTEEELNVFKYTQLRRAALATVDGDYSLSNRLSECVEYKEAIKEEPVVEKLTIQDIEQFDEQEDNASMNALIDFVRRYHYIPRAIELKRCYGVNVTIYEELVAEYIEKYEEEYFANTCTEAMNTPEYREEINRAIKSHNRFIISSVAPFRNAHEGFLKAIDTYSKYNNAVFLALAMTETRGSSFYNKWVLDCKLKEHGYILFGGEDNIFTKLNSNLEIGVFKTNPNTIKPFTGIEAVTAQRDTSLIIPGAYQQLTYIPNEKGIAPKSISCTGRCTYADHMNTVDSALDREEPFHMPTKREVISKETSTLGAMVVEIVDDRIFHIRNIVANEDGSFIDANVKYNPDGTTENIKGSVFVVGDLHAPKHNEELFNYHLQLAEKLGVSEVVLHDAVNFSCVSHHNDGKPFIKSQIYHEGFGTITSEAEVFTKLLDRVSAIPCVKDVTVVSSNHPLHLDDYIKQAKFKDDTANILTSLKTWLAMVGDGSKEKEALPALIEDVIGYKNKKVKFLERSASHKVYGIEVGFHGSDGANGGRGSTTTQNKAHKKSVMGHKHSACIDRNALVVGIVCNPDQGYNHGLSSWTESSAIVYPNGTAQLITFLKVDGEYKAWL